MKSGLVPTLLRALEAHSTLAQQSLDSEVTYEALEHLLRCRQEFDTLDGLVDEGQLPEAVDACRDIEQLLGDAPTALANSDAMVQLKVSTLAQMVYIGVSSRVDELGRASSVPLRTERKSSSVMLAPEESLYPLMRSQFARMYKVSISHSPARVSLLTSLLLP